ncbi:MAG: NAD-dependent epimerase/dehydratase family protein, partial [Anaerolineales bacterium]
GIKLRVLVTGATGFIGSNLCHALVEHGYLVRAFHRPTSNLALLKGLEIETFAGDITDLASLQIAMQGVDIVFHCAAQLGQGSDFSKMKNITVNGTQNVVHAALENGVQRLIHTSSVAALGVPPRIKKGQPYLMDETHTWNYRPAWWMYGYTKYLAELEIQKGIAQGLDAVIVNPTVVLGAGDIHQVSGNIIIYLAHHPLPMAVEGGAHIADVIAGHLAALNFGKTGERYILGGENLTHFDFLSQISHVIQQPPPKWNMPANILAILNPFYTAMEKLSPLPISTSLLRLAGRYFYYDTRKAQNHLHLSAPRSIVDAIHQCYDWYIAQGVLS